MHCPFCLQQSVLSVIFLFFISTAILLSGCGKGGAEDGIPDAGPWVAATMDQMTAQQKIGQLVMAASTWRVTDPFPRDVYGPPTETQTAHLKKMITEYHIGSVIIYNTGDMETIARFNKQLQNWSEESGAGIPLFISADLEYGLAQRVPGEATAFPRQMGIAASGNTEFAFEQGRITAVEARAAGFNWSFSPVVDVNVNPANPVIGVRSFGEKVPDVSAMAVAMIRGSQGHGVLATPKHFPGHGDTGFDSHYDLSRVSYSLETLHELHLPPFQAAFDAGADAVMSAHVIIDAIDPGLPATLSHKVLRGLLREELGFRGLIVTDAMGMDAINNNWGAGEAAVMAVNAGADIIMATGNPAQQIEAIDALNEAYENGKITDERLDESVARILAVKHKYGLHHGFSYPDPARARAVAGYHKHREMAREMAARSITLIRNSSVLPFDPHQDYSTLVAGVAYTNELASLVAEVAVGEVLVWDYGRGPLDNNPTPAAILEAIRLAEEADRIIVFTYSSGQLPEGQKMLVDALRIMGKPIVVVALGLPTDILSFPDIPAFAAAYSLDRWPDVTPVPVVWEAVVDVLFGENPGGRLPVTLSRSWPAGHGLSW